MSKGSFWTEEDENLLKENYLIKNNEELSNLFPNRTLKAIRSKANKFNLKKANDYEKIEESDIYKNIDGIVYKICKKCRRYLPLELKYFPKDLTCDDGFRNICKECKGEKFNISKAIEWSEEDIDILIREYPFKSSYQIQQEYFPCRKVRLISQKASLLGIYKTKETMGKIHKEKFTNEVKLKMSNICQKQERSSGIKNPMYGTHRVGKLNPNWKGGISSDKQIL